MREAQRGLGLSNASLAQYHLNKLKEMGLVREENGEYEVAQEVQVDAMRGLLKVGTLIVPRFVFYAVLFSVFTVYLGFASYPYYQQYAVLPWFEVLLILASAVYWYEAAKAWFSAPSF